MGEINQDYEKNLAKDTWKSEFVNSRLLTYVSEDPDDLVPLSPSVFLQEVREIGVLDCDMLYHSKFNKKAKYRLNILKDLRTRFRTEYLGQLVIKNSKEESRKIKPGDVVLIGDDLHRPLDWPLAKVVEMYPGRDGNVTVALLKTKDGLRKRALQRIFPLEVPQDEVDVQNFCKRMSGNGEKIVTPKKTDSISKEVGVKNDCNLTDSKRTDKCTSKNKCNKKVLDCVVTRCGRRVNKPQYFQS